jgi:hypothetical protein
MAYNKKLRLNAFIHFIFISIFIKIVELKVNLLYPVSFGVVRYSSVSVSLTQYMQNIGYPNID